MRKETKSTLSPYLMDLLSPTPSGVTKLLAVWEDLDVETQIQVLISLDEAGFPIYLEQKVRRKALDSPNAYIRYLAARELRFSYNDGEEEKTLKNRITVDPDPLVKYCLLENEFNFLDENIKNPELFFNLPHEARLAKIRQLSGSGEAIASLISYATDNYLEQGRVSEIEL
ncbi:MAG: hypothetical protein AB7G75_07185 [Candidatus Binatia bacterium]